MAPYLVEMRNIHKWFGAVHALKGVDFAVKHGEIVGLVGDNGAGKSTLVKCLIGVYQPDEGEIYFEGKKVKIDSPKKARELGIEMVFQDQALVPDLSIYRNIFLGREPKKYLMFLNKKLMMEKSLEALQQLGVQIRDVFTPVRFLSGGEQQATAIARAMLFKAKLIILDEPTNALSVKEAQRVLEFIKQLKQEGIACIFITHNIHHVYSIADRIVILNRGKKVGDFNRDDVTIDDVIKLIVTG
jgi:simple sugar transport system ATP-binding protein